MRIFRILQVMLLGLAFGLLSGTVAFAQTSQASFTLQPGGSATITYEAYCTDFGKNFPTTLQAPNGVAEDKVRAALAYIQQNNLSADQNQALEAQYGIWQLRGAAGSPAGGDVAKAVVKAGNTPPTNPQGTSLLDAVNTGQVKLTLGTWQPIGNKVPLGGGTDNFYGRGQLTVQNTSQQAVTLYMPVGTLFPPATAGEQTMAAYATNVQVTNPQSQNTQQGSPQQLPNTGGEDMAVMSWLLVAAALAFIAAGTVTRLHVKR